MIDIEKITKEVESGEAVFLDLRRDEEWDTGHAKLATRFEFERFENGELPNIPKDMKIYTACNAGGRAGRAKEILEEAGFTHVENAHGIMQWKEAGGEVVI
ncbi:MAG: rhodanese-like domain-containing protein [Candidatus Paceibacterota bacterium]